MIMQTKHSRHPRNFGVQRILLALGQALAVAITRNPGARFIRVQNREYPIKQRPPDLELLLEHPEHGKVIAIVELQGKANAGLPLRMAVLTTWLVHEHDCPVIPVVLHLGQAEDRCSAHFLQELAGSRLEVKPVEIVLAEMDAREVLEMGMHGPWWPFIPLMRHGDDPAILDRVVQKIKASPDLEHVASDMMRLMAHGVDLSQVRGFLKGGGPGRGPCGDHGGVLRRGPGG